MSEEYAVHTWCKVRKLDGVFTITDSRLVGSKKKKRRYVLEALPNTGCITPETHAWGEDLVVVEKVVPDAQDADGLTVAADANAPLEPAYAAPLDATGQASLTTQYDAPRDAIAASATDSPSDPYAPRIAESFTVEIDQDVWQLVELIVPQAKKDPRKTIVFLLGFACGQLIAGRKHDRD